MPPHCDSLDGPVVKAGLRTLEEEDASYVLPFVPQESEREAEDVLDKVIRARLASPEAREVADRYFLETVVRLHRAGEGAPYTGLRPAGLDHGPAVPAAELALDTRDPEELIKLLLDTVEVEVKKRFHHAIELKASADQSVDSARRYVEAMLGLQLYANGLYEFARHGPTHGSHQHPEGD
jgi:Family of unknown function (DUF6448)